ncbi:YaaC family protein [Lederbergia citrea]|uniref:YaaC family protein n=1 Tax=Lederbergia citrea TaxID=2833581 RepID=UPI001BC9143C|nr:YaaC family protein [Lederbergia citrea]MBS4179776.1 YaaC family protein [Lederbergia citrea]MBS4206447.1 YaaC family protein [Lederbergia citrea]
MENLDFIWKRLNFFQSADTTQRFLKNGYHNLGVNDAELKSYDNCYPFMYYLEQGELFYNQAALSPFSIKPILLFYGLVHLLKACILTTDPFYPSSTSVLAHGVSARKRKKRQYYFYHDEIKIQKYGLCPHFSEQMFHVKHLEGEKFIMGELFSLVAELDDAFLFIKGKSNMIVLQRSNTNLITIPREASDLYHMDDKRLKQYLNDKYKGGQISWQGENDAEQLTFERKEAIKPPFRENIFKQVTCLPARLHSNNTLPDMIIHYLILYNLSMIARYETEWWFELIKTTPNSDYPFIKTFLDITEKKGPFLVYQYLMQGQPL